MIALPVKAWLALAIILSISTVLWAVWAKGVAHCQNQVAVAVAQAHKDAELKRDVLTTRHLATIRILNQENAKVREELRNEIHDDPDCYYTPTARLLLDKARGVSESASVDAGADEPALTHTSRQAFAQQWAADAREYGLCRERIDAFIEWHKD